jgi:hypothetical protein
MDEHKIAQQRGGTMGAYTFAYNERLEIELPELDLEWEEYNQAERSDILLNWEQIRGTIPDRIFQLERVIIRKQAQLDHEDDFRTACLLNSEIAELASTINDLHLWFRVHQDLETKPHS